ncbi:MAG TPA: alpha/beta fold hydrolase [Actinomycetota bacterium]|nr:alpha/beta fold hydrolase [Actinomycetota bacterium]
MDIQTGFARSGASHIAYQVLGDGPVDMVFMSAWFSHIDGRWEEPMFARMLRRFSTFARLIVFDKRGSGASDPLPQDAVTWEDWADDIRCVMDAVGSEKAAIVGVGDSGPIAMLFAATYPERVTALVCANTTAKLTADNDYPGRAPEQIEAFLARQEENWGTGGMMEIFCPSKANDDRYRQWWAKYQRMSASPGNCTAVTRLIMQMDVRPFLSTIQAPTLVVQRKDLAMVPVEHGRYLGENIPGARYVELPGADYFIYIGAPDIQDEIEEFITGVRAVSEPDRVLATVMFTDIVGSTTTLSEVGDRRWKELLDTHDYVIRRNLDEHRGRLVNTTGDGILATFDGPARAIRSAFGIRDGLRDVGISIRCGLHTGELEVHGEDVRGMAVHIGARVMSIADADQVVVSRTVKDLTVGSGIVFRDRGEHTLKGVPEPWQLFEAVEA